MKPVSLCERQRAVSSFSETNM